MVNSKKRISRIFLEIIVIITTLTIVLLATVSIFSDYRNYKKECKKIKGSYISEQESTIKYEVEQAVDLIQYLFKNSGLSQEMIRKISLEHLKDIRFPNKGRDAGFFFVRSYDGILMLSISTPELIGKDVSQYTDLSGNKTHKIFMDIVNKSGNDFVDYSWYNPYTKKNQKKRSYIKAIPELNWYIGAGFWHEDINSVIDEKSAQLKTDVQNCILQIILIIFIAYAAMFIISRKIARKIRNSFSAFSSFFSKAAHQHFFIEKDDWHYPEFKELANSANQMIYEREQSEKKLSESEARFRTLIEQAGDAMYLSDLKGNILDVNNYAVKEIGYSHREFIELKVTALDSEYVNPEKRRKFWNSLEPGKPITIETNQKRKDGSSFPVEIRISLIEMNGLKMILGFARNISDRKLMEKELEKYRLSLEGMVKERTKELEEKNKDLEAYNDLFIGREFRIKELRDKVKELEGKK